LTIATKFSVTGVQVADTISELKLGNGTSFGAHLANIASALPQLCGLSLYPGLLVE